jgi:hypothetical protein
MSPSTKFTSLLQQGIDAARAGRSAEARQSLQQVVHADPKNETAWLWLSGLVTTIQQKQTCLEQVLRINPGNVHAREGLTKLKPPPQLQADVFEARLAAVTSGNAPATLDKELSELTKPSDKPALKQLQFPQPSNESPAKQNGKERTATEAAAPNQNSPRTSNSIGLLCPGCDHPVSPKAKICPHCKLPFKSLEEMLQRYGRKPPPAPSQRFGRRLKRILGR